MEWLYALAEGMAEANGYEVFDFPGGLYAVATAYDEGPEIERVTGETHRWLDASQEFARGDGGVERYEMGHVISPEGVSRRQMELFVPVVKR